MHTIDMNFNKLTPNYRRFDSFEGNIEGRLFFTNETLFLVNKLESILWLKLTENPDFNFKEQK